MAVLPLDQAPPMAGSLSKLVLPGQTWVLPAMPSGKGLTVNEVVIKQPLPTVYVIVTVPVVTLFALPDNEPIEAMLLLLLVHVPPVERSPSVVVVPWQMWKVPVIGDGAGVTLTVINTLQPAPME
jgi:hypothetical protein